MIKVKKYQIDNYISDATQSSLDLKADLVYGKVPSSQLPSYVDDVIEVANYSSLPNPGSSGVIYITTNNNKVYRWGGSGYTEIASGVTNLSYIPNVSNGVVASDTGDDAIIPLANGTNAGLITSAEKNILNNTSGVNTGDQGLQSVTNVDSITTNSITALSFVKNLGQPEQFLKADGSVDNNVYLTSADLPATLSLFATTSAAPGISGYTVLVRNMTDSRYNTTAVDISTGVINSVDQLVGSLISDANTISGHPGVFEINTIGNIRKAAGSGSGTADFYFRVYKRDSSGIETLICQSAATAIVPNGGTYTEFTTTAIWDDGVFLTTDRIVIKYYANRVSGGSNPTYEFQFGGLNPVRSIAAVPVAVIPNIYLANLVDVENVAAINNEVLYWNDTAKLWEHALAEDLVPDASATNKGLINTTNQTLSGIKSFSDGIKVGTNSYFKESSGTPYIYSPTSGTTFYVGGTSTQYQNNLSIPFGSLSIHQQTASTIASFDASQNVVSLTAANGYPTLDELKYVKGVTSAIQTQFSNKQASSTNLTSLAGLTYSTSAFVKMTAAGTFTLDTSSGGAAITLSAIGSSPNANAATITGSVLNLQPASASFGGVVTTGTQTFAGQKTFSSISFGATGLPTFFEYFGTPFFTANTGVTLNIGGGPGTAQNNLAVPNGTFNIGLQTASTIASFDASKNVVSLTAANGYPTLAELKWLAGTTSSIQTQFSGKQATLSGTGFVKSTAGTISYDTNTYYLASNPSGFTSNTGTVTSVTGTAPVVSSGGTTPAISMAAASASVDGYLTAGNFTTFNNKLDANAWVDYSATTTTVGWSSFTTKLVRYIVIGKSVTVFYVLSGTSNANSCSFTMPFNNVSGNTVSVFNAGTNNGVNALAVTLINTGSNVISSASYFTSVSVATAYTASGTKLIRGTLTYEIA